MDLRDRVLARYKTGAAEPPLGNESPPSEQSGLPPVMGASGLPGGNDGGPGKRNIPKDHPYDPRALKPLSQMLWAMSVSLGHALTAYRKFTRLKSSTISPDGMLGGRGYVMQVKEIRSKLHDACESLSTISDTIHDEINAPHWEPKLNQLDPNEALDVRKFIQESQQILQNPEEEAEEDMESVMDSAAPGEEAMQPQPGVEPGAEPDEEGAEETEGVSPEEEEAFTKDQQGAPAEGAPEGEETPEGEEPEEGEETPESEEPEEGEEEDTEDENEETPPLEDGEDIEEPVKTEEEPSPEESEEEPSEEKEESSDEEEPEESDEDEEEGDESEDEEDEDEKDNEEEGNDDEEDDEESDEDEEGITPEDEALAEEAIRSSGLPGGTEPPPAPLGKPKKKKKRIKVSPGTVQDQKFQPETAKFASYDRRANSSVNPDSLGGPRVHHLDRADAPGQFNSENDDPPTDDWALSDGRPESDDFKFIWRAADDDSVEKWWDGMSIAEQSEKAMFLKLLSNDRAQWTSGDWEKVFSHQASSGMPEDTDTHTDGYDFGLGYGAKGDGAGGYANPSGEGNGYQGVYGPTSGLPTDHAVKTDNDDTSKIDVDLNNVNAQNSVMPTDVEEPVARSDYYTEGLSDEMIAQSELPAPERNPYNYDRDLPNTSVMLEDHNTPYIRYDYTTPNYRPDPNYSRPER